MIITKDSFEALLEWLDPNRDEAALRFERIRSGLIRMFVSKGLIDAEFYADETVDRVIKKLPEIRAGYTEQPVRYFHGVAKNIVREAGRRREIPTDIVPECLPLVGFVNNDLIDCLRKCLGSLSKEKCELIHDYYVYDGNTKIESRREMAKELSISIGALRTRAHHVRAGLENCVRKCMNLTRNKSARDGHNSSGANNERSHR